MAKDPTEQFQVKTIAPLEAGPLDISLTNSSFFMFGAVLLVTLLLWAGSRRMTLVPTRGQSMVEGIYEFVSGMIGQASGKDGMRFFPFVFTLFIFILALNMLGMFPLFFTVTSQIVVTFAISILVMAVVIGYGVYKNGFKFLKIFVPSGVPLPLYAIVTPIEIISFLSRPISLSVRLWANMLAGHILLKVFAGFIISMSAAGFLGVLGAAAPFAMTTALTALEFLVAFLQAYVFALLTCIYLNDALHPGH